jgi:CheY-like chemotaxis protein
MLDRPALNVPALENSRSGSMTPAPGRAARSVSDAFEAQTQSVIRKIVLDTCPHTLTALRGHLLSLMRQPENVARRPELPEMFRAIHSLTGNAGLAGLNRIAQMSSALEALIQELDDKPQHVNASSLRSLSMGVDALGQLFESSADSSTDLAPSALTCVVDDDTVCGRAVSAALDKVNLRSISLDDPELAVRLLDRNRFDLIFLDIEMPGLNGFELAGKVRGGEANRATPIVFVTSAATFESRAGSMLNGGSDLIAKPFLLIELAVKALTYLSRTSPNPVLPGPEASRMRDQT